MEKKTDRELGMQTPIPRRDFIHGVAMTAVGALLAPLAGAAETPKVEVYPPARTGLRGSHPGAYEVAHALALEKHPFPDPTPLNESYDLVIVGAGLSGLAAAHYYQARFGPQSRILLLDNHDDFGGHARRNEFHQGGVMRLALGGTHNLEHWDFSRTVRMLMKDLGIDVHAMVEKMSFQYGRDGKRGRAIWFDAATYGQNRLVDNYTLENWWPGKPLDCIDQFPISSAAKSELRRLFEVRESPFKGQPEKRVWEQLAAMSYPDFLRRYGGLGEEALQLFQTCTHPGWGIEVRAMSAREALEDGLPGSGLIGMSPPPDTFGYPVAMFPDGNASVARLLVHKLIPAVAPGTRADNVAMAKFDYEKLDETGQPVRLRLNSTVVNVANSGGKVQVSYSKDGQLHQIQGRHCVMACYHSMLPYLCPEAPESQKAAQRYQVKIPLLLTNVLLRTSKPFDDLGISGAVCPGRMHRSMFLSRGISTGGYEHEAADAGPVVMSFWGSISPPAHAISLKDQLKASRMKMLQMGFSDYEREVRTVLKDMLAPVEFDVGNDILAITVNRWPHGYAYEYMDLWDERWPPGEAPHEIARQPVGNISIANSDAGASAYTHVAIDQAYRAVKELG